MGCNENNHVPDEINHAPMLEALSTINIAAGKSTTVDVIASDKDGDALTYSLVNKPDWVSIQDSIISIAPSHADIGQYVLNVKVSDGSLSAEMNTEEVPSIQLTKNSTLSLGWSSFLGEADKYRNVCIQVRQ
ncbi:hypothetical protein C0W59_03210 [Photobacterium kishitanii]|uniref:Ig-like domain-containing protein n=1 Tax=Photobacterium kishitanii TaxID=318456 RepID=UPI000D160866|nr:hypothetical protein [Photobacterium kishitanii]PSV17130.1 hypothetical protein C0W59_03210 [Photobacterium kishitanii]